jgi:hypothetical protein
MTPLTIGGLLAAAAMIWVIAPIFGMFSEEPPPDTRPGSASSAADDAAEAAIRRWREQK